MRPAAARSPRPPAHDVAPPAAARTLRRLACVLVGASLVTCALYAALGRSLDTDLWWGLATGRYIVEQGRIPDRDVFTFTAENAPWVNQEWLSHVLHYVLFRELGGRALALYKIALAAATVLLAASVGRRRSGSFVLGAGSAMAAAFLCRTYFDIRPQLFTFLGALAMVAITDAYRRGARPRLLLTLPLLTALWANLHFGFVYGAGSLLLIAAVEIAKAASGLPDRPLAMRRALWLGAAAAAATLATAVNPEGFRALTFPFTSLQPDGPWKDLVEWQPTVLFARGPLNPIFFGYFLVAQIVVAAVAAGMAPRRFDLTDFAHVAATGAMAISARRFIPLFALVSAPFLARNVALIQRRLRGGAEDAPELERAGDATAVGLLAAAVLGFTLLQAVPAARADFAGGLFPGMVGNYFFPAGGVEFLARNPLPGRLYHPYVWGGYLTYWLPERKVFIYGGNVVYPLDVWQDSYALLSGDARWSEILDRRGIALVLWPTPAVKPAFQLLLKRLQASPSWQLIYDDKQAQVFAHVERGSAWIARYRALGLEYPATAGARSFLADVYLEANEFVRARETLADVIHRFPEARPSAAGERAFAERARRSREPRDWFLVGFLRDATGDARGALEAYRTALAGGLASPHADYARDALARLEPSRSAPATPAAPPQ